MWKPVLYDLTILRRSARAAFAQKRDLLLLAVVVPLLLTLAFRYADNAAKSFGQLPIGVQMAITAFLALLINAASFRRLAYLREESVAARHALQPEAAAAYIGCWNLAPLAILGGLVIPSPPPLTVGSVLLAYLAGGALGGCQRSVTNRLLAWSGRRGRRSPSGRAVTLRGATRPDRAIALLAGRSGLFGPSFVANLIGLAMLGAAIGGLYLLLTSQMPGPAPSVIAGLLILVGLLASLRAHPSLLRYLTYLGLKPGMPALVASAFVAAVLGGALVVSLPAAFASPLAMLAAAATLFLLFAAVASLRTLHFATKPAQSAELAMMMEIVAIAMVGFLAPPLAPFLIVARLWLLLREARAMRYLLP